MDDNKSALLLMGCPEVPVQNGIVLYLSSRLNRAGYSVTLAGTDAALKLIGVSDPEGHYVKKTVDIDVCIANLAEKKEDYDVCFAFMHNDAGATYAATVGALSRSKVYALIFGRNAEALADSLQLDAEKIVAKAVHNPLPLKNKLDRVIS